MSSLLAKWRLMQAIVSDPAMSRADVSVAATLLDMVGPDGTAWPSLPTLASRTAQTTRNVIRCVARLCDAGYFEATDGRGRGHSKVYRAIFARAEKVTPTSPIHGPEKVTAKSPISTEEKVTAPSPFPPQKVTSVSRKGDTGVAEKVTPMSPRTYLVNPPQEPDRELERSFAEFWAAFPAQRRATRAAVLKSYSAIVSGNRATAEQLLAAAERYAASSDVVRGYACAPLRWLREERWQLAYRPSQPEETKAQRREREAADSRRRGLAAIARAVGLPNAGFVIEHEPG